MIHVPKNKNVISQSFILVSNLSIPWLLFDIESEQLWSHPF